MDRQQIYEIIINNLPIGFMIVDEKGITVDCNETAEKITGYSRDEMLGKDHIELFHTASKRDSCPLFKHAFRLREPSVETDTTIRRKDGDSVTLSVTIAPLFDKDGRFVGGVELFRDISERRRLERERKNILSMFAHDMKNPVMTAQGFLGRILSGKAGQKEEYFRIVLGELKTLESLIADFLEFSRFEAKQYKPVCAVFDLVEALFRQADAARIQAEEKDITVTSELGSAGLPVNADSAMIHRVVSNLLDNAIRYTAPGGAVTVRVSERDRDVLVKIEDTGSGIPAEHVPFIFDAFYRISRDQKGSGLGLSIAKTVIEAHGGRIWVESAPGKGTTFSFTLPKK